MSGGGYHVRDNGLLWHAPALPSPLYYVYTF